jgi:hypothetical protein
VERQQTADVRKQMSDSRHHISDNRCIDGTLDDLAFFVDIVSYHY